jgi:molybdenum cofactor guanylyltransferase
MACAVTHGRTHPVFGLWPLSLREDLRRAMVEEEIRKVDLWTARYKLVEVDFPDTETPAGPLDPFFNTNRPEDLEEAARYLG